MCVEDDEASAEVLEDGSMRPCWRCELKSKDERDDGPLAKITRKAGLRPIGWHTLRHYPELGISAIRSRRTS